MLKVGNIYVMIRKLNSCPLIEVSVDKSPIIIALKDNEVGEISFCSNARTSFLSPH